MLTAPALSSGVLVVCVCACDWMAWQRQGGALEAREHRIAVRGFDGDGVPEAFDGVATAKVNAPRVRYTPQ